MAPLGVLMRFLSSPRSTLTALALLLAALAGATTAAAGAPAATGRIQENLFPTAPMYVDPNGAASVDLARAKAEGDTDDLPELTLLAQYATPKWFADQTSDITHFVDKYVTAATAANALPVMVAYYIPHRDCGGESAGGAPDDATYKTWIKNFAAGIGSRKAVVIVEPDALFHLTDCLDAAGQAARLDDLRYGTKVLAAQPNTSVYIDAGGSTAENAPVAAAEMARRLQQGGITNSRGFSVNVALFRWTTDAIIYGHEIEKDLGTDTPFIIDTSRNGLGPTNEDPSLAWCNPPGRALGLAPGTATDDPLIDQYLWIKTPGNSDGACRPGSPPSGKWYRSYAVALVRAAVANGTLDKIVKPPAPVVNSLSPASGPTGGGTLVTIKGGNFNDVYKVRFGSIPAISYTVVDDSTIVAVSPPQGLSTHTLYVTTPGGTNEKTAQAQFKYVSGAPVPVVTGISPTSGPTSGGTTVTVSGSGFTGATKVRFGSVAATSFTVASDTTLVAVSPPQGKSTHTIYVTTEGGTNASSPQFVYTNVRLPVVKSLSPSSGPIAGGTVVFLTGKHFTGATRVKFGAVAATNFIVISDTEIVAVSPPEPTSRHGIYVTTRAGTNSTSPPFQYTG